jgi:hypothetical protein
LRARFLREIGGMEELIRFTTTKESAMFDKAMSDADADAKPDAMFDTGFAPPRERELGRERSTTAVAALIATIGLTIAVIAAVTVVSMGFAEAATSGSFGAPLPASDGIALAVLLGLLFAGVAGMVGGLSELHHRRHLH